MPSNGVKVDLSIADFDDFSFQNFKKKIYVADSMAEIFLSSKNVSIGMWNDRFWRNFGCTFFLQLIWLQHAVHSD